MIKKLEFTPANLQRHLTCPQFTQYNTIFTTRHTQKGNPGDIFYIPGVPGNKYFVLLKVTPSSHHDYYIEGFTTPLQFTQELQWIYGRTDNLYLHELLQLNEDLSLLQTNNIYIDIRTKGLGK